MNETTEKPIENKETKKKEYEVESGAIWVKQSKNGKYLSIKLELDDKEYNLVGFKNKFKVDPNDNKPSYRLYLSKKSIEEAKQKLDKQDDTDI